MIELQIKVTDIENDELGLPSDPDLTTKMSVDPLEIKAFYKDDDGTSFTLDGHFYLWCTIPYEEFQIVMNTAGIPINQRY